MIDISHIQAQRLIRIQADGRLPEEQWLALQAHLEGCAACRVYRGRLLGLERELGRQLTGRWQLVRGPRENLSLQVLSVRRARQKRLRSGLAGSVGLLALLLWIFLVGPLLGKPALPTEPQPSATPLPSPTPTALPADRFQGVVLFEDPSDGSNRLRLLTAGPGGVDLANLEAAGRGSDPSWSPDGEWLAFLSSQNKQEKPELYVMSVAGSRLTRLTNNPQVDWQGPLAWSGDGHWIALIGRRRELNNESWIYLVPLDNSARGAGGSRVLPGTRGVSGGLRFTGYNLFTSPYLLYEISDAGTSIVRYDMRTGQPDLLTLQSPDPDLVLPGQPASFEYFDPGSGFELYYLLQVRDPATRRISSQIRRAQRSPEHGMAYEQLASGPPGTFRGLSLVPQEPRLVYLQDPGQSGCWQLQLRDLDSTLRSQPAPNGGGKQRNMRLQVGGSGSGLPFSTAPIRELSELCITSSLDSSQWTPDGRWLVVLAHPSGQAGGPDSFYALGMPPAGQPDAPFTIQRLDLRATGAKAPTLPQVRGSLHVRPAGEPLGIRPKAIQSQETSQVMPVETAKLPAGLTGSLLFTSFGAGGKQNAILDMAPDGQKRRELLPADAANTCPAASPAGWIAFLSNRNSQNGRDNEVFLMKDDGASPRQLTHSDTAYDPGDPPARYDCPVWAPDGAYLTAVWRSPFGDSLVVMTPGGGIVRAIPVNKPSTHAAPVWTRDGRTILLAEEATSGGSARLVAFPWRDPAGATNVMSLDGWDDLLALALSPDGRQLAALQERGSHVELFVYHTADWSLRYARPAGLAPTAGYRGRIAWLPDDQVVYPVLGSPLDPYKFSLVRYSPADDTLQFLVLGEDVLYDWAINGSWLVYASESGVWGMPVIGRFDRKVLPLLLRNIQADQLSWR